VQTLHNYVKPLLQFGALFASVQQDNTEPHFSENNWIDGDIALIGSQPPDDPEFGDGFVGQSTRPSFGGTNDA
jgi:hypothetical protein